MLDRGPYRLCGGPTQLKMTPRDRGKERRVQRASRYSQIEGKKDNGGKNDDRGGSGVSVYRGIDVLKAEHRRRQRARRRRGRTSHCRKTCQPWATPRTSSESTKRRSQRQSLTRSQKMRVKSTRPRHWLPKRSQPGELSIVQRRTSHL